MADEYLGVCVVVLNEDQTHVLAGRRLNSYAAGWYGLPGGRLEFGEPVQTGAIRELLEETGLEAQAVRFVGVVRDYRPHAYSFIHFAFTCTAFYGEVCNTEPDKCGGWEWLPLQDRDIKLLPAHEAVLDWCLHPRDGGLRDIVSELV